MYHSISLDLPNYGDDDPTQNIDVTYMQARAALPDYRIAFGRIGAATTYLNAAEADYLALSLVEALFDSGEMSNDTARRIVHLAGIIVDDPQEAMAAAADSIDDEGW